MQKVLRGTVKSFSVGGVFKRRMTPKGPRIWHCDLGEVSITPYPVNPRTGFHVVAGKALTVPEGKAVLNGDVIDALDARVIAIADTLQRLTNKDDNMNGYRDWFHDRSEAPEITPEEQRQIQQRRLRDLAAEEGARTDGVRNAGETIEILPAVLFGGNLVRDEYGQPVDTGGFTAEAIYGDGSELPDELPADDLRNLFGVDKPKQRELTPNEVFALQAEQESAAKAREERDAASARRLDAITERLRSFAAAQDADDDVAPRRLRDRLTGASR